MIKKDALWSECSFHDNIKNQISRICNELGYDVREEYKGKDWRADVLVLANGKKYAFEVQISKQNLNRTLERQNKYTRDNIIGCWLFEKEPKQKDELENLPLFKISNDKNLTVSLKDRKKLPLKTFISDFLNDEIKFCQTLNTQALEIRFLEMKCWKCGHLNHIYYVGNLISPCNAKILHADIEMWQDSKFMFEPEIIKVVTQYVQKSNFLEMGEIKKRYSGTIDNSYLSFGCSKCDSIFGDWFVFHDVLGSLDGDGVIDKLVIPKHELKMDVRINIPHWCHPGDEEFCD